MDASSTYNIKKCGIRFSPPAVIIVYEDIIDKTKLRKYIMPVRNFRHNSSVSFVAEGLKIRHEKMLTNVPEVTIEKMLRLLQEHIKGTDSEKALEIVNREFSINSEEDLNKLGDQEIKRKKEIMDQIFNKNRVKPDDPEFVYDKRVDFDEMETEKKESGWDNEETDDFWK